LVKDPAHLEAKDHQVLAFIQQEKEIDLTYRMAQQLIHLLKNQQGETATAWISMCSSCGIAELEAFALGLQKELPAFQAACSLPYSNGMTEGFVNKLKHIKGSMYGRGSFELLRQRMLQPSASLSTTNAGEPFYQVRNIPLIPLRISWQQEPLLGRK
jgi:transposase